ncbi:hypothetical protein [Microbacterium album]|uniref:Uncharacterized protein n=1 Tax=Microbacterium album TaxID=2053191 RepID=A0A917MLY4_9MICO|nr:hypothetical protein [Microbacterium album]GGH44985.1 hypothetical protein GCM10010921_20060 [Microbacterium album]
MTDAQRAVAEASEIVVNVVDANGAIAEVGILGVNGQVTPLDKGLALAVADRLATLAADLPNPPRFLKRDAGVDERLRGLDD